MNQDSRSLHERNMLYWSQNNDYLQSKYKSEMFPILGPSEKCWENSWSFPVLTNEQKINFKNFWNESLTP